MKITALLLGISLVVSIGCIGGCLDQEQPIENQNQNPVASCSGTPTNGAAPLKVIFVGTGYDPDGVITFYHWDFGDGAVADLQNPSHLFLHEGNYTVTLIVTDNNASAGSSTIAISVLRPTNYPPNASMTVDRTYGLVPLTVAFRGSGTDADGIISSYHWDFGDGSNSSQQNTLHTFIQNGIYNVTLIVTDNQGATDGCFITIKCTPVHNLTQKGINYICEQYGDASHCIVSEGLIFNFTEDTNQTYTELPGGTTDILGFIMMGVVESVTMTSPRRSTIDNPLEEFLEANAGFLLDSSDVVFLLQHDESSGDQWCYIPLI
jgi:PKD repeat protein